MAVSKPSLPPGTLLEGVYRVGKVLGEGGMGCVYEAINVDIDRPVAIKHLHDQFIGNEEVVERFHREARLAASIGHDNICEVIDFDRADDGSPFLVMPRLEGKTLSDLMAEHKVLSIERITDILCQVLSGLQAAHDTKIVHRDMKPENIFITTVGDRPDFVKLLDFGISKIMDCESVSSLTQTGLLMGTPHYMSPEQASGIKEIDQRTDIWAVGVILYEAITGQKPFEGDTYLAVLHQIGRGSVRPPSAVNPAIPAAFEKVVLRAIAPSIHDRYQHADEMRVALSDALMQYNGVNVIRSRAPSAVPGGPSSLPPPVAGAKGGTTQNGTPFSVVYVPHRRGGPWPYLLIAVILIATAAVVGAYLLMRPSDRSTPELVVPAGSLPALPPVEPPSSVVEEKPPKVPEARVEEEPVPAAVSEEEQAHDKENTRRRPGSRAPKQDMEPTTPPSEEAPPRRNKNSVKGRFKTEIDAEYE